MVMYVFLSGCIVTKAGAYRVYAEDIERLSGERFTDAYIPLIGRLANLVPESIKTLNDGNTKRYFQ